MAAITRTASENTDEYGIERVHKNEPGFVDKLRDKWSWFDHIMAMQERYASMGGNQYSAGITYFSVLSMFPILMLVFAAAGFVLAARPETLSDIQMHITDSISGDVGSQINEIIDTAIKQRSAIAGIGALTALWSGLNWMDNLRYGVSKIWKLDPGAGNFVVKKLWDLVGLIALLVALIIAFGITAAGSSGVTSMLLEYLKLDHIVGIDAITRVIAITVGLIANYLVFFWLIIFLPRGKVPVKSAAKAAVIGAIGFELIKQLGSVFFSSAVKNPAGATFGPIIGVMVLLYLIWRILLYSSAWAATTKESLELLELPAPEPAIIRVRTQVAQAPSPKVAGSLFGAGAVAGIAAIIAARRGRK